MALTYGVHHEKAMSAGGFGVGAKGSETDVVDTDGTLYQKGTEITATADEMNIMDGVTATATEINQALKTATVLFTEDGGGTYTGTVDLPAEAILSDIIVTAVAVWTAGTSAAMIVGDDTDPNGFFDAINLKATDLLDDESINFSHTGGLEGAYLDSPSAGAHVTDRYSATARTITGEVTSDGAGTDGRTLMTVVWLEPTTTDAVKAT